MTAAADNLTPCALLGRADKPRETWCGRQAQEFDFTFVDAGHALLNLRNEGRLGLCQRCGEAMAELLRIPVAYAPGWPELKREPCVHGPVPFNPAVVAEVLRSEPFPVCVEPLVLPPIAAPEVWTDNTTPPPFDQEDD